MLPPNVMNAAFCAANGELAWQVHDVAAAVRALADQRLALLGGEVWIVRAGQIVAAPLLQDGRRAVVGWSSMRTAGESWAEFAERAARETITAIDALEMEATVVPEDAGYVFYNLTFVTEAEYAELG